MSLAEDVVARTLAARQESYAAEVRTLIDATYRVIAATGSFDPPIRAILAEAGLSNPAFYRHFRTKDELLLVMLDEGRRRLIHYLDHRIDSVSDRRDRIAEWVRGVLAQAKNPEAARRTRPFVTGVERLHEKFPREQEASEQQLVSQLAGLFDDRPELAQLTYTLVFGELERFLRSGSEPSAGDVELVVDYVLAAVE